MKLNIGDTAPDFILPSDAGRDFMLSREVREAPLILYFYPKDFTPGCTAQACSFRDHFEEFGGLGVRVVGINTDSLQTHAEFKKKHRLPFELLSDRGGKAAKLYGARMPILGVAKRISFLIGTDQKILYIYDNLFGAEKHIDEMLRRLRAQTL